MSPQQQSDFTRLMRALINLEKAREYIPTREIYADLVRMTLENEDIEHWPALQQCILSELASL